MEDVCLRMPNIMEQINELLDDKSLVTCKRVSRMMCSIIEHQKFGKFLTTRVIQRYIKNPRVIQRLIKNPRAIEIYINNSKKFANDWRIVFQKFNEKIYI